MRQALSPNDLSKTDGGAGIITCRHISRSVGRPASIPQVRKKHGRIIKRAVGRSTIPIKVETEDGPADAINNVLINHFDACFVSVPDKSAAFFRR